jgi:hypothetical protein
MNGDFFDKRATLGRLGRMIETTAVFETAIRKALVIPLGRPRWSLKWEKKKENGRDTMGMKW